MTTIIHIGRPIWSFFLKMQGEQVWNAMEFGWGLPLKLDGTRRFIGELNKSNKELHKIDNKGNEVNA